MFFGSYFYVDSVTGQRVLMRRLFCRLKLDSYSDVGWLMIDDVSNCLICGKDFNMLITKHHCKACGNVLCSLCCKDRAPISELPEYGPLSVCKQCYWGQETVEAKGINLDFSHYLFLQSASSLPNKQVEGALMRGVRLIDKGGVPLEGVEKYTLTSEYWIMNGTKMTARRLCARSSESFFSYRRIGWLLADDVTTCLVCAREFNGQQKHHCSSCGNVICDKCLCKEKALILELIECGPLNVCSLCYWGQDAVEAQTSVSITHYASKELWQQYLEMEHTQTDEPLNITISKEEQEIQTKENQRRYLVSVSLALKAEKGFVENRLYNFKTYPSTFIGSEAVSLMIKKEFAKTVAEVL